MVAEVVRGGAKSDGENIGPDEKADPAVVSSGCVRWLTSVLAEISVTVVREGTASVEEFVIVGW